MMEPFDLVGWLGDKPIATTIDFGWGVRVVLDDDVHLKVGERLTSTAPHIDALHEALTNAREFLDRIGHSGEPS